MIRKTKNKYNHYTEDFRREAVRRSEDPNTSAAEVAKELGIHPAKSTTGVGSISGCQTSSSIVTKGWIVL